LSVAHYNPILYLLTDHLLIIVFVILQDSLHQLQTLSEGLVFDLHLKDLTVFLFLHAVIFFKVLPQLSVCFQQLRYSIHRVYKSVLSGFFPFLVLFQKLLGECFLSRIQKLLLGLGWTIV